MLGLQMFVIDFFDALDAAIIEVEYALIEVLIPNEYKSIFGTLEMKLCFDYEVYLENPEYELVVFGSFILDKIINLSFNLATTSIRYAVADNIDVTNPELKIKKFLGLDRNNIEIIEETKVNNYFTKYNFRVSYVSDNTIEEFEDVVIDMNNYEHSSEFEQNLDRVFYDSKPQYDFMQNSIPDFIRALKKSIEYLEVIASKKAELLNADSEYSKEVERICTYYESLKLETEKRMHRKNLSEEKVKEYANKINIYESDKMRQLEDVKEKYRVKSNLFFQNAVVYAVPSVKFTYRLIGRNVDDKVCECFYNPIFKTFFRSIC